MFIGYRRPIDAEYKKILVNLYKDATSEYLHYKGLCHTETANHWFGVMIGIAKSFKALFNVDIYDMVTEIYGDGSK